MQSAMEVASMKSLVEAKLGTAKLTAADLSKALLQEGLQQVVGGSKEDEDGSSLTATFISQALNVHKTIMSQPQCVEVLMDLEAQYGSRSCLKLNALATKPASAKSRIWVLEAIHDMLGYGLLKVGDVSKGLLMGDRTHFGNETERASVVPNLKILIFTPIFEV